MGFSDIEPYGGEIHTPALNSLATNGLRFTQFYIGARCCPTRATLLTGLYAHQTGIGHMVAATPRGPGYLGDLNKTTQSFENDLNGYLKAAGEKPIKLDKYTLRDFI